MKSTIKILGVAALATALMATGVMASTAVKKAPAAKAAHTAKAAAKVELPAAIKTAFETAYPKATIKKVSQEKENGEMDYEVESMDGTMARDLVYRADGTVVEVEEVVAQTDLPAPVSQAIATKYPKGKITKAEKVTRGEAVQYEMHVGVGKRTHEVTLDATGAAVTVEKEAAEKKSTK